MIYDESGSLSALSHEIKTYIGISLSCIGLIEEKIAKVDNEQLQTDLNDLIDVAKTNTYKTLCIANNFIDADRLLKDKYSLNLLTHNLTDIINKNLKAVESYIKVRGAKLEFICNVPDVFLVCIDENIIDRILLNLLSNSIKNLPIENGRIVVLLEMENGIINISVRDNGKGITKSELPFVFDCHYSDESLHNANDNLTRMGLHVCKMLANLLDGDITVESQPFMSTNFTLHIPKKQIVLPNVAELRSENKEIYNEQHRHIVKCIFAGL